MIGALVRVAVFLAVVVGATLAVSALLRTEGGIAISVAGYEVFLTPLAAIAALVGSFLAVVAVLRLLDLGLALLRLATGDAGAFRRFFERGRARRGLDCLGQAMTALAAGDGPAAVQAATRAERYLRRPDLTRVLNAQAAELAGDTRRAQAYYKALAADPDTTFVGIKGMLGQALASGDTRRARHLAEHAAALEPEATEVLATLYRLQSEAYDWAGARKTLSRQRRLRQVSGDEADRREATLALAQAEDAEQAGDGTTARRLSVEAARLDPANPEAVCAAARHLVAHGEREAASRLIVRAWTRAPVPSLAAAFAAIEPDERPEDRRERFSTLFAANPTHRETRFLRAELALMAEDWSAARAAVEEVGEREYSARSCALLAAVARGEGASEAVVRGWLARALGAARADTDSEIGHAAMLPLLIGEAEWAGARGDGLARGRARRPAEDVGG